jgi:hypothetical protein
MFMPENAAFCYPLHEKCGLSGAAADAVRDGLHLLFDRL